jgi:hypothetical protein
MTTVRNQECWNASNAPQNDSKHSYRMLAVVLSLWALALGAILVTPVLVFML